MDYEKIGGFIAAKRKEKGMTQKDLAELLGVTDRAVSKWERAKSFPDVQTLKPLCEALGVSLGELFDGEVSSRQHLTRVEAGEIAMKGIRVYVKQLQKKQKISLFIAVFLVLCLIGGGIYDWQSRQPVHFEKGDYEIGTVFLQVREHEKYSLSFLNQKMNEDERRISLTVKQNLKEVLKELKRKGEINQPQLESDERFAVIDGVGRFYRDGYTDFKNGKSYAYENRAVFDKLNNILYSYSFSRNLTGEDLQIKDDIVSGDNTLTIPENTLLPHSDAIFFYYAEQLNKTAEDYSKQEIKRTDLQVVKLLTPEEYKNIDRGVLENMQAKVENYNLYDCWIYQVNGKHTYTKAYKKAGVHPSEDLFKQYFLIGRREIGIENPPYEICYVSDLIYS